MHTIPAGITQAMQNSSSRKQHTPKAFKSYRDSDLAYRILAAKGVYDIDATFSWTNTHR